MLTYFFSARQYSNSSSIEVLCKEFGENIPQCLPLEGGEGINYLFCVNMDKQKIKEICKKHNFEINGEFFNRAFTEVEVNDNTYNNNYYATISYDGTNHYVLKKINST